MKLKNLWDGIASNYDKKFGPECERIIERIKLELRPEDEVLEVACGTGLVSFSAAERCRSVFGLTPSLHRLSYGQILELMTSAGLRVVKAKLLAGDGFPCAFIVAQAS
jgi:cyclopropane fatty-acyl-phospholipid synthase-like methyltransferase